jgi:hypothetical protein
MIKKELEWKDGRILVKYELLRKMVNHGLWQMMLQKYWGIKDQQMQFRYIAVGR